MNGPIALVGGAEWLPPAHQTDAWLLERARTKTVLVVPTAAARQRPEKAVRTAREHFAALGAEVEAAMILKRQDAETQTARRRLAAAPFIYIAGGDPGHLTSVLRDTPAWEGILEAHRRGAMLAGSSAGAMVLCDRVLRPGAGRPAPGLGLLTNLVVIPHHDTWGGRVARIVERAGGGARLLGIDESSALVVENGRCQVIGPGSVTLYEDGVARWSRRAPAEIKECL